MNAAGYADTPLGRAQYATGVPPSGDGKATSQQISNATGSPLIPNSSSGSDADTTQKIGAALDQLAGALQAGDSAKFQELVREFNLNYANSVATLYGQNWGPGNPAPIGAATLASGQATGYTGYVPGFSGINAGQTSAELAQQASTAQAGAGLTGFYSAPSQSQYTPGTFVRLDPGTYDTNQYGPVQISYVLPSGQLQRVNIPQAQAMGWNGNLSTMPTIAAQQAIMLERAPPQQTPQQTLQGLTTYSNLNTAAQNAALAESGATGYYQRPATVQPPGTNAAGGRFQDLDQGTQQAYFASNGSDWNAAMAKWVADSNAAIQAAGGGQPLPNGAGQPTETLAAQQQYFNEGAQLATQFGQYYQPGVPGQAGQAGVNMPQVGQQTLAANEQYYRQQLDAINAAAALQANPFRQQQVIGQVGQLLGGQGVAAFQAPNTTVPNGQGPNAPTAASNPQGGAFSGLNNMQAMIDDIRSGPGGTNSQSAQGVLDAIPTPNKINSPEFFRMTPQGQQVILSGMQQKYGIEAPDALAQIKSTLPAFTAPTTFGTVRR
jgi:hypothetical protein